MVNLNEHFCYRQDNRNTEPNKNQHRKARFRHGWRKATAGDMYTSDTLEDPTWDNLGFRLVCCLRSSFTLFQPETHMKSIS